MHELVPYLLKRRKIMMGAVIFLAAVAIVISFNFTITASTHFGGKYNSLFIYFLIIYKLIELPTLYYLLLHRHLIALKKDSDHQERIPKLRKHAKLLLFLIPQGNTVFGIIAFKLSGNVLYFLLFSGIAIITLFLIKPNKFKLY